VRADHLIDTTDLTQHDLKAEIASRFDAGPSGRMSVSLQSFSYKRGVPRGVDMIFDCRFLANPHWQPALARPGRPRSGGRGLYSALIPVCRVLPEVARASSVSATGTSGRGQGPSCRRVRLYRRATQVGGDG
jgi:hypothetical protein